jgi:DNA polymerase-3 subunit delta'
MSAVQFLPWQLDVASAWLQSRERFAHAWLLHGLAGIGKVTFATAAAASLLCEAPRAGLACGECAACAWVAHGTHPDLRRIRPDVVALEENAAQAEETTEETQLAAESAKRSPSKEIRIEQIRALETWFNTATHRGGWRVALLYPAHTLNLLSANALLKVLEEPPPHTVFLLVAEAPDRLLPTLVSRCRRLPLPVPHSTQSLAWLGDQGVESAPDWLAAVGGAPLAALRLARVRQSPCPQWLVQMLEALAAGRPPDVGVLVEALEKTAAVEWIDLLQRLHVDLLLAGAGGATRYFPSLTQLVVQIAARSDNARLAETARWLSHQRAVAAHPLNPKLFAHTVLQRVALAG